MPRALYILARFAEACRRQGFGLTVMLAPNPPTKRYLVSYVNDTSNVVELPVATDDATAMASLLPDVDAIVPGGEFS